MNNKSLGVFSELRLNQVDGNPLDLLQTKKRPNEPQYITGRERKKRIVPLDKKLIDGRYKASMNTFGTNMAQGFESLQINVRRDHTYIYQGGQGQMLTLISFVVIHIIERCNSCKCTERDGTA